MRPLHSARYIGGWKPERPTNARKAVGLPSRSSDVTTTFAPGTSSERSVAGCKVTTGTPAGTSTVFSPSL